MSVISTIAKRATVAVVATGTFAGGLVAVASPASAYACTAALATDTIPKGGTDHAWVRDCAPHRITSVQMGNTYRVKKTVRKHGKKRIVIVTKHETITLATFRNDAAGNGDTGFRIPFYDGNGHAIALGQHVIDVYSARGVPAPHRFAVDVTR